MHYNIDTIMRHVRIAMGFNGRQPGPLFADSPQLRLDQAILAHGVDAAATVLAKAPADILYPRLQFAQHIVWNADGNWGWTLLPDDFMRLIIFEMADWSMGIQTPIGPQDAAYKMQKSKYLGIRGCPERPVCALVPRATGNVLEFYSCSRIGVAVKSALYLPRPAWDEDLALEIPSLLFPAFIQELRSRLSSL